MLNENLDAGSAAGRVGYESASQFSREYQSPVWRAASARYHAHAARSRCRRGGRAPNGSEGHRRPKGATPSIDPTIARVAVNWRVARSWSPKSPGPPVPKKSQFAVECDVLLSKSAAESFACRYLTNGSVNYSKLQYLSLPLTMAGLAEGNRAPGAQKFSISSEATCRVQGANGWLTLNGRVSRSRRHPHREPRCRHLACETRFVRPRLECRRGASGVQTGGVGNGRDPRNILRRLLKLAVDRRRRIGSEWMRALSDQ